MKYGFLLLLLVAAGLQAQVYRSVDKYGNVIYSDVESDNAEEVIIDLAPSYTAPEIIPLAEDDDKAGDELIVKPNYQVNISSPAQNETFQNPESITVIANISPVLNAIRADKLLFKLDGKIIGSAQVGTSITLTALERGSHILLVSIVDKTGKVIKKSKSVLFHVHRRSIAQ